MLFFTSERSLTVADPNTVPAAGADAPGVSRVPDLIIQPKKGWIAIDWAEMSRYRELLYFLIWRDVKVRYKQSVLGVAWAVIVPVLNMLVFTVIFNKIFGLGKNLVSTSGDPLPYAIMVYAGLLPWQLFSNSLSQGGLSLLNQQHLLTKVYFPRLFIPTSAVGGLLVDMGISFLVLVALMVGYHFVPYYHFTPPVQILTLPLLVLLTVISGLAVAYTLSALTVTYRDFRFLIPFAVQILSYVSFVQYPSEPFINGHPYYAWLLACNPMFGTITAFRWAILGQKLYPGYVAMSAGISLVMLVFGAFYFRKTERRFADIA
jgi:lipopolysaccharide transport system permease protein